MTEERLEKRYPWILKFHDLMPHRIREVLLVSSDYDAFVIEEDGRLSERLFVEYSELNLVTAPRIIHAATPAEALRILKTRRIDLVLTTMRADDPGVRNLAQRVKSQFPELPVVLLVLDEFELRRLSHRTLPRGLDRVFLWTGDTRIMLAILKVIEDSLNVEEDTSGTGVQVIIVVEDSVRRYSTFLAQLYGEMMLQSQSLVAEGVNALHRMLRMMARPKILLATSYEEAWDLFQRYEKHVLALITDIQFPRNGVPDDAAGFELTRAMRQVHPNMPVLLQSANPANAEPARGLGVAYADKNSPTLLREIRSFLREWLGFGDFVFRLPDRTEIGRARDMYELEQVLRTVDIRSLYYHASHDHFNVWLRARSMFELADEVEGIRASEYQDHEKLRAYLVEVLHRAARQEQEGVVADFSWRAVGPARHFVKIGTGSIGGKGRGIAFLHSMLVRHDLSDAVAGLAVRIPRTVVVSTDEFDRFLEHNGLDTVHAARLPEEEVERRFRESELPRTLSVDLRAATLDMQGPLAVRSSSLLEDSQHQSCAGIYDTCILPNNHPDPEVRFRQLSQAIRRVYASTFSAKARAYLDSTPFSAEEEKMAVVIQEVVGVRREDRFYPHFSGVAQSYNYYPVGPQEPEDGVVMMALGLGHTVAEGGRSIRFSPRWPDVLPHLANARNFLKYSQTHFYAVDLSGEVPEDGDAVRLFPIRVAEKDDTFALAGSVYSPDDDQIRENLRLAGPRVVTFNNVLKWGAIPFAEVVRELLGKLRLAMGCPVEIEFAVDLADYGRSAPPGVERRTPTLNLLQIRPISEPTLDALVETEGFPPDAVLCHSNRSLGHGFMQDLHDVVYVKTDVLTMDRLSALADEIGQVNARLHAEGRCYMLIGPGRWGSSDPSLGIPVDISRITGARLIVELPFGDRDVEPSQGSHFFHELTSMRIGYLTLTRHAHAEGTPDSLDWDWLHAQPSVRDTANVRHVRLEQPLHAYLDGRLRKATVLKPGSLPGSGISLLEGSELQASQAFP